MTITTPTLSSQRDFVGHRVWCSMSTGEPKGLYDIKLKQWLVPPTYSEVVRIPGMMMCPSISPSPSLSSSLAKHLTTTDAEYDGTPCKPNAKIQPSQQLASACTADGWVLVNHDGKVLYNRNPSCMNISFHGKFGPFAAVQQYSGFV